MGSVDKVIQGCDIQIGIVTQIENTRFHTRAEWQAKIQKEQSANQTIELYASLF